VFKNFEAILEWNRSLFYALSVGHLADRLSGAAAPARTGPKGPRLRTAEVARMQRALNDLGFETGGLDGMVGKQTRQAIRDFQRARGLAADAYPSPELISHIMDEADGRLPRTVLPNQLAEEDIRALQRALSVLGYEPGPFDGLMGNKTRGALSAYLRDRGMTLDSGLTPALVVQAVQEARDE
jgi:peptidoglycan hydrolase-like protein with peptidoglycan-binding domain